MGLLPDVARSLSVTIPQAGYLVSGYALGVVIGAPIVAMATAGIPRKTALLVLMALFTIGNLGCALAPDYWLLMTARVVTAFAHGAFFGIGAVVASNLVPREQRTRAVSLMFAGLTLANVLGVPFGTALGQSAGWRCAFWAVVVIGIVAFLAITRFVPSGMPGTRRAGEEFRALGRWPVLLPMLISTIGFSQHVQPLHLHHAAARRRSPASPPHGVTGALLAIGVGLTIGNLIGGRLADRNLLLTIIGAFICLVIVLGALALVVHMALQTWCC